MSGTCDKTQFFNLRFTFEGVALFEIFENKTPSKITRYTVLLSYPCTKNKQTIISVMYFSRFEAIC